MRQWIAIVALVGLLGVDADAQIGSQKKSPGNISGTISVAPGSNVSLGGAVAFDYACAGHGCADFEAWSYTKSAFAIVVHCTSPSASFDEWFGFEWALANAFVLGEPSAPLLLNEWADVGGPANCTAFIGYYKNMGGGSIFIALGSTAFDVP